MKAIVYHEYGSPDDVLELQDIDKPVVGEDEVLVRVRATSVNPYDWHWITGLPYFSRTQFGLRKPKVDGLGADMAGQIEAVGKNVTQFRPGDEVFGDLSVCGIGAFAEYICASEDAVVLKPTNLTFEQAAAVPLAATTALQGLRDHGRIQPGQKVLINGASGGVGTFAVQIAKSFGAEVTGVCSTRNADMVRSIGADHVIDYTQEDFTRSGQRYDLMLDLVGNRSVSECRSVLTPKGVYMASFGQADHRWLGPLAQVFRTLLLSLFVSQKMTMFVMKPNQKDLIVLQELLESGKVTPVIDRTYPLSEVPEAFRYLEDGHARGKVVITV
ncbi:MAG: NAD(P)-dependent alcohol dehydrogenase [Acidimicrobiia bacterium]|nr:NAD(P)-dependent alcohol dehydrogenase [Acidimicrobiia bacterium]